MLIRKEQEQLKRLERVENVKKINKQQEYEKQKIIQKIQEDNERAARIQKEKHDLIMKRKRIKMKAQLNKQRIVEKFTDMKNKGKISVRTLKKFGIDLNDKSDGSRTERNGMNSAATAQTNGAPRTQQTSPAKPLATSQSEQVMPESTPVKEQPKAAAPKKAESAKKSTKKEPKKEPKKESKKEEKKEPVPEEKTELASSKKPEKKTEKKTKADSSPYSEQQ